jgi:hypothetical protein
MKKILFILLVFISAKSFSQIKIGLQAGYNSANFAQYGAAPLSDYGITTSAISTFNAGVVSEIPLHKRLSLQGSLFYFGSGSNVVGSGGEPAGMSYSNTTLRLFYLRLPVNIVYKIKLNDQLNILTGAGLYIAKGLSGTQKGYQYYNGDFPPYFDTTFLNNKVHFADKANSSDPITVKSFDFGYNILAGLEWKEFQLTATYCHGFSQVFPEGSNDAGYNYKNAVFGVSLAYLFTLKK